MSGQEWQQRREGELHEVLARLLSALFWTVVALTVAFSVEGVPRSASVLVGMGLIASSIYAKGLWSVLPCAPGRVIVFVGKYGLNL